MKFLPAISILLLMASCGEKPQDKYDLWAQYYKTRQIIIDKMGNDHDEAVAQNISAYDQLVAIGEIVTIKWPGAKDDKMRKIISEYQVVDLRAGTSIIGGQWPNMAPNTGGSIHIDIRLVHLFPEELRP